MNKIILILMSIAVALSGCNQSVPSRTADWCYKYDFVEDDYGASIQDGTWIDGSGLATVEDDLRVSLIHPYTVEPLYTVVSAIRPDTSGSVSVIAQGNIFGITLDIDETIPPGFDLGRLIFVPESAGSSASVIGQSFNIALKATSPVIIQSLEVLGTGTNPFPESNCDTTQQTPTPLIIPTAEATATITLTPTPPTFTPTDTHTPTETHTPTHTFTPTTCSLSSSYDFRDAESDMVTVLPYWQWDNLALGLGFDTVGSYEAGEGYRYSERRYGAYAGGAKGWERGLHIRVDFPVPMPLESFQMTTHAHGGHSLRLYADDSTYVDAAHGDPYERAFGWPSGLTKNYTHAIYSGFEGDYEIGWVRGMSYTLRGCAPTATPTGSPTSTSTRTPRPTRTPNPSITPSPSLTPVLLDTPGTRTYTPLPSATRANVGQVFTAPPLATLNSTYATYPGVPGTGTPYATITPDGFPGDGTPMIVPWQPMPGDGSGSDDITGITDLGNGIVNVGVNLMKQVTSWLTELTITIGRITDAWYDTPAVPIPGVPDCMINPLENQVCAIWYILRFTIFGPPIGHLIIPIALAVVDLSIIFAFIKLARAILARAAEILKI